MTGSRIAVVGIGADGWAGLGKAAHAALVAADDIFGSARQLALLPDDVTATAHAWPSPMAPMLDEIAAHTSGSACVLASGDPMLHGIGATLARRLGPQRLEVHPHASAFAFACARLGWPAAEVELISTVARAPEAVARVLTPGRRVIAYVAGDRGAAAIAGVLCARGFGPSRLVVLEQLGGPAEAITDSIAETWGERAADPLHTVAIECRPAAGTRSLPTTPGLPDDAYAGDGQLTKRHIRAITLATLAPMPGQLLWDVGAASGSIAIEWLRAEPSARAIAIESRSNRAEQAIANALRLGVPELEVRVGRAPGTLGGLPSPDAVFIGGGLTTPGLVDACWHALTEGGRIVANSVTLEGEQALATARAAHGGQLVRIDIAHAEPLGAFTGWCAQRPVVQWTSVKP